MAPHYEQALNEAINWINKNYNADCIIVSGSIIRGNPNPNSDFDIYVIHSKNFRQRVQKYFAGVPCEILVNTRQHILQYFEDELAKNRPVTAHMISTGMVYKGAENEIIQHLINIAKEYVLKVPVKTEQQILMAKYMLANLFEDINDIMATDEASAFYILNKLVNEIIDFVFLTHATPLPRIKERLEMLKKTAPIEADLILQFYTCNDVKLKYEITNQLLIKAVGKTSFFEWSSEPE